jgi:hypothetical protein
VQTAIGTVAERGIGRDVSEEPEKAGNTEAEESRLRGGSEIRRSCAFKDGGKERKSLPDVSAENPAITCIRTSARSENLRVGVRFGSGKGSVCGNEARVTS